MKQRLFSKNKWMMIVFLIAIILIISGFAVWLNSFFVLISKQQTLANILEGTVDYYRVEGSLEWWRTAYKTTFFPSSLVLIVVGALVVTSILLRTQLNRQKNV